jgi:type II secretory pathway pseudopilin PulG
MSFLRLQFNKKTNDKTGLTLVETLVAISILTIAVIGPLGIIAQALHTSYYTRDQMTAHYLAQEAIEYVRNLRDNKSIEITGDSINDPSYEYTSTDWLSGIATPPSSPDVPGRPNIYPFGAGGIPDAYSLVINDNGTYKFEPYNDQYMKVNNNGIYGVDAGAGAVDSQFKREIYFQATNNTLNNQDFVMVVSVYWKNGSTFSKLILKEYFTNWASRAGL